jgi:uncharacterized protein involved in response to NO
MSLLNIEEPAPARPAPWGTSHPIWRLGFRPFYLVAAVFAALSIPLWVAQYYGWIDAGAHITLGWHMHEMVFGMSTAVVIGFLFTAARNWTNLWTPREGHLAALVALWLAGRVAMAWAPPLAAAVVDWAFLPAAAWPLFVVMKKSANKRNYFLVGLLSLLAVANGVYHAIVLGLLEMAPAVPAQAAVLVIVVMESAIGTRVIPMFTRNGAPGSTPAVHPKRDMVSIALLVAAGISWIAGLPVWLVAPLGGGAATMVLVRLIEWQPHKTLRVPLLWILHLSYGWIAVGFFMLSLAAMSLIPSSAAFHALTVGSMAGLILGMMTRTTLGHTGRPLKSGKAEFAIYALIQLGAVLRVAATLVPGAGHDHLLICSALCWTLAFAVFAVVYLPYLTKPRIDGREG